MLFYAYFSVSKKRNIRRSQNVKKSTGEVILEGNIPDGLGPHVRGDTRCSRGWGAPPLGRAPYLVGPPWLLRRPPCTHIYPRTLKVPERKNRSGVPPPEASVATKNQSRPIPAPCRRGNPSLVAIFLIPALSVMRRE